MPSVAQIVSDNSGIKSKISREGNTNIITGGSQAGNNLFHSFEKFSVINGDRAFFKNDLDIENILVRVTGSSASNIDGLLQANGKANPAFLTN